jgi:predicted nucleic acid-binding protein
MATKKVICDTDVMIDYFDNRKSRHLKTKEIIENIGLDNIIISAITKMELIVGTKNKKDSIVVNKKLGRFDLIIIDSQVTLRAIELLNNYSLSHGLAIPDGLIAATAIETNLRLFTYNIKDFKFIKSLLIYK